MLLHFYTWNTSNFVATFREVQFFTSQPIWMAQQVLAFVTMLADKNQIPVQTNGQSYFAVFAFRSPIQIALMAQTRTCTHKTSKLKKKKKNNSKQTNGRQWERCKNKLLTENGNNEQEIGDVWCEMQLKRLKYHSSEWQPSLAYWCSEPVQVDVVRWEFFEPIQTYLC